MALDPRSFIKNYSLLITKTSPSSPYSPRTPLGDFMQHGFSERVYLDAIPKKNSEKNIGTLQSYGP